MREREYDCPDMSYVGPCTIFFSMTDLQSKEELLELKKQLGEFLSDDIENDKLSDIKRLLLIRKLNLMFLYLEYHVYFEKRYGRKSYRYIGKGDIIEKEELEDDSKRIKASKSSSLIDNYGYDGGFVDFWAFGDSIVFRTIKKIK